MTTPKPFVQFTRLWNTKDSAVTNEQKITVATSSVASVRPSNKKMGQRTALQLSNGTEIALADTYTEVRKALGLK